MTNNERIPFDWDLWRTGEYDCFTEGVKVCGINKHPHKDILGIFVDIDYWYYTYNMYGNIIIPGYASNNSYLYLIKKKPKTKTVWCNIYSSHGGTKSFSVFFESKKEAIDHQQNHGEYGIFKCKNCEIRHYQNGKFIKTIELEIPEEE